MVHELETVEKDSRDFTGMSLVLAINYGARDEILRAGKKMLEAAEKKTETDTRTDIGRFFDIPFLPDADLIIRTGGEKRLSNFLLWHAAYAEFDFSDILWPDYTKEDFYASIAAFQKRHRRFGGIDGEEK